METTSIKVEAVTKEPKVYQGSKYWGVKAGDHWYDFYHTEAPKKGFTYHCELKTTESNGKTYYKVRPLPAGPNPAANGKEAQAAPAPIQAEPPERIPLEVWCAAMRAFHAVAMELEPDTEYVKEADAPTQLVDRSAARLGLMQTSLIALRDGKISVDLPEEKQEGVPF